MFEEVFWDAGNDMMGLLRSPEGDDLKHASYEARRGIERVAHNQSSITKWVYRTLLSILELH